MKKSVVLSIILFQILRGPILGQIVLTDSNLPIVTIPYLYVKK